MDYMALAVLFLFFLILAAIVLHARQHNFGTKEPTVPDNSAGPCANCSKCHWYDHCVCTFGSKVCQLKYEPREETSKGCSGGRPKTSCSCGRINYGPIICAKCGGTIWQET
jgi:hypothetical protein